MQQPVKRKKILKWLRKMAALMPEKTYQVAHKLAGPVYTDAEGNLYTDEMEKEGIPKRMVWKYIDEHPINHKRRMLKMWDRFHDVRAIAAYMEMVGGITLSGEPVQHPDASVSDLQPDLSTLIPKEGNHLGEEEI